MKQVVRNMAAAFAALALFTGCASLEWRSGLRPRGISKLDGVKRFGVFSFTPSLVPYGRIFLVKSGTYYIPFAVPGLRTKVALLHTSPEAMTDFGVTAEVIGNLTAEMGAREIGATADFDYEVWEDGRKSRLMGAPLPDAEAAAGEEAASYESVTSIPEVLSRGDARPETIKRLGRDYGVEVLLGLEPTVTAEIGRVTDAPSDEVQVKAVPIGNFVLLTRISMGYVLYDATTGARMTDSDGTRPAYSTAPRFGDGIWDLGINDLRELNAFLARKEYAGAFDEPLKKAFIPYLGLFRQLYVATLQEKQE
jgi:hypothetical protein